jgi:hypothetical protein
MRRRESVHQRQNERRDTETPRKKTRVESLNWSSRRLGVSAFIPLAHLALVVIALAGCAPEPSRPASSLAAPAPQTTLADIAPPRSAIAAAAPVHPPIINVSLYQLTVPAGAVSANPDFWKWVDPPSIDDATVNRLDENGLRVGEAAISDWSNFRKIFDAAGASAIEHHFIGPGAENQEFAPSAELGQETLFFYDAHGLSGRVYDQCQNLFILSYRPAPAPPGASSSATDGAIELECCPMVRGTRRQLHYTVLNGEETVEYKSDERIFDLGLRVDLPPGRFLIVAPSAQSQRTVSIGHAFLTQDATAGRRETVLIFVAGYPPKVQSAVNATPQQ